MFIKKYGKYNDNIAEKFNDVKKNIFLREKKEIVKEQIEDTRLSKMRVTEVVVISRT